VDAPCEASPGLGGALEGGDLSDSYSGGLAANWEADLWGGIRAGIRAATPPPRYSLGGI